MEMITYLKRRFSSGDLQGEVADKREQEGLPSFLRFSSSTMTPSHTGNPSYPSNSVQPHNRPQQDMPAPDPTRPITTDRAGQGSGQTTTAGPMQRGRIGGAFPSAPTSPSHRSAASSFMGPMSGITGHISNTIMRGFSTAASTAHQTMTGGRMGGGGKGQKILLVIDDAPVDWSKYFKGQKILGEWEIRVEQAQFSEITMTAYSDQGCVINIRQGPGRGKAARTFKPDFVLLRQHASGSNTDWQPILTGLMFAGTPCMNTLHAVYNMKNRPWLFAHLLLLRKRLGKGAFPLITQTYHTSHEEMVTAPAFPTIIKVGFGHGGEGKIRADTAIAYEDVVGLLASMNTYATTEPFVDAKCDVHVQKIGTQYKAFARKSISGHWKSNAGSAILEKVPMNERFKLWVDEVSRMFGGLDICSVEVLQNKTDEYFIYDVNGSDSALFGESQEEDRREIAELVTQRMQTACAQSTSIPKPPSLQSISKADDFGSAAGVGTTALSKPLVQTIYTSTPSTTAPSQGYPTGRQPSQPSAQMTSFMQPSNQPLQPSRPTPSQTMASPPQQQQQQQQQTFWQAFGSGSPSTAAPASGGGGSTEFPPWSDHSSGSSSVSSSAYPASSSAFSPSVAHNPRLRDSQASSGQATPTSTGYREPMRVGTNEVSATGYRPSQFENTYGSSTGNWTPTADGGSHSGGSFGGTEQFRYDSSANSYDNTKPMEPTTGFSSMSSYDGNIPSRGSSATTTALKSNPTSNTYPSVPARQTSLRTTEDSDDTMKNLRKTFAGIFGDM